MTLKSQLSRWRRPWREFGRLTKERLESEQRGELTNASTSSDEADKPLDSQGQTEQMPIASSPKPNG